MGKGKTPPKKEVRKAPAKQATPQRERTTQLGLEDRKVKREKYVPGSEGDRYLSVRT